MSLFVNDEKINRSDARQVLCNVTNHLPLSLTLAQAYPKSYIVDNRGFEFFCPSGGDIVYFEKLVHQIEMESTEKFRDIEIDIVPQLIRSLDRTPTAGEVLREYERQSILRQIESDWSEPEGAYFRDEIEPQRKAISARTDDFPQDSLEFKTGAALWETLVVKSSGILVKSEYFPVADQSKNKSVVQDERFFTFGELSEREQEDYGNRPTGYVTERLIIRTKNSDGSTLVDHPVMSDQENEWVDATAKMMVRCLKDKSRIFIAGLGMGILNHAIEKYADLKNIKVKHVVSELNVNVPRFSSNQKLKKDLGDRLKLRMGDWRDIIQEALAVGETFDAISIDAYPNEADDINCDSSSKRVLKLAYEALNSGGVLTFYPDSRYIPYRALRALHDIGIPNSAIHYTVAEFDVSSFTERYHYGNLMGVVQIRKPICFDEDRIKMLEQEYFDRETAYSE